MEDDTKLSIHSIRTSRVNGQEPIASQRNQWNTHVAANVPILFCTSNGLHLRVMIKSHKPKHSNHHLSNLDGFATNTITNTTASTANTNLYNIRFCDLERWVTIIKLLEIII